MNKSSYNCENIETIETIEEDVYNCLKTLKNRKGGHVQKINSSRPQQPPQLPVSKEGLDNDQIFEIYNNPSACSACETIPPRLFHEPNFTFKLGGERATPIAFDNEQSASSDGPEGEEERSAAYDGSGEEEPSQQSSLERAPPLVSIIPQQLRSLGRYQREYRKGMADLDSRPELANMLIEITAIKRDTMILYSQEYSAIQTRRGL